MMYHELFQRETIKRYLEDHSAYIVQTIMVYFERQYGNLFGGKEKYGVNVNSDEGNRILYYVCPLDYYTQRMKRRRTIKRKVAAVSLKVVFSFCLYGNLCFMHRG